MRICDGWGKKAFARVKQHDDHAVFKFCLHENVNF